MNSMNYIGKVISNFKDFYNEINAATLTGAIDVIVVEQPDGSFTCSPFHVRFGKLGVLRSREKVVDIEINGQPQDIHMKLGDSGEAFFVEEVESTESESIPEHLTTSPIPVSDFEELYSAHDRPRRNSIGSIENQKSDYTQRRYTGGTEKDFSAEKREFISRQFNLGNIRAGDHSSEDISLSTPNDVNKISIEEDITNDETDEQIFKMDSLTDDTESKSYPKVFTPETVNDQNILKKEFIPIKVNETQDPSTSIEYSVPKSENIPQISISETKVSIESDKPEIELSKNNSNSNNKKKRRKMKKKNSQRKTSVPGIEAAILDVSESSQLIDISEELKATDPSTEKNLDATDDSEEGVAEEILDHPSMTRAVNRDPDIHFFSDTELTSANSVHGSRPSSPVQSDTEFEFSQRRGEQITEGQSWDWGQLPNTTQGDLSANKNEDPQNQQQTQRNSMLSGMFSFMKQSKRMRHKDTEGLYLADLSSGNLDPEVAALYFPRKIEKNADADNDCESGNGPSIPQSPNSVEGAKSIDSDFDDAAKDIHKHLHDISLSLCGWSQPPTPDSFLRHLVAFTDLCNNPTLFEHTDLVIRINDKYYNWKTAVPIIMTPLIYQRPLPQSALEQLCDTYMPEYQSKVLSKPESRGYSYWWYWRRNKTESIEQGGADVKESKIELEAIPDLPSCPAETTDKTVLQIEHEDAKKVITISKAPEILRHEISHHSEEKGGYSGSQSSEDSGSSGGQEIPGSKQIQIMKERISLSEEKYRKTLRLTSDQIASLDLLEGMNEVDFSVTTAYQGTTRCKCHLYRWRYDDKIVISDIDGTITKSDVLGHILPIVGKDWAQSGVAQLFTKIKNNGYKLLYLSARAIGQARVTREYLRSIKQGNLSLPDGPLLLNPTSLISAFHREVIEKKPEQFKIQCLSDIQALFPIGSNPFYAGYGNRINDVWAYRAVGIPIVRIFTINHKGELKHELTQTFQSSYSNMSYIVDQLFPPILESASEYSQFVYWRDPVVPIEETVDEVDIS